MNNKEKYFLVKEAVPRLKVRPNPRPRPKADPRFGHRDLHLEHYLKRVRENKDSFEHLRSSGRRPGAATNPSKGETPNVMPMPKRPAPAAAPPAASPSTPRPKLQAPKKMDTTAPVIPRSVVDGLKFNPSGGGLSGQAAQKGGIPASVLAVPAAMGAGGVVGSQLDSRSFPNSRALDQNSTR